MTLQKTLDSLPGLKQETVSCDQQGCLVKRLFVLLAVVLGLNFTFLAHLHSGLSQVTLEEAVREKLQLQKNSSVLILMKEKADLSPAAKMANKNEKGAFVYEALRTVALESQKDLVAYLESKQAKYQRFYIANMIALQNAPYEMIDEISKRSDVEKIYENPEFTLRHPLRPSKWKEENPKTSEPEEGLQRVHAVQAWKEFNAKGQGIVVAGEDSGVEWDHPALIHQYRGDATHHDYNWHDAVYEPFKLKPNPCGYQTQAPCDDGAHGTHTMGTILGSEGDINLIGVAPEAKWMACRPMDEGTGTPASYIDCFEFFLAPYAYKANPMTDGHPELAPHVINNSWGCPLEEGCSGREMIPVLEALQSAGIFVVASAGNDGPDCSSVDAQPAHLTNLTLSVGALQDKDDTIAFFSSRGPSLLTGEVSPDLTAPGMNIRSSVPGHKYEGGWSGTSMAGPHVTGVVALLWSAVPDLVGKVKETRELLRKTSKHLVGPQNCGNVPGDQIPNNTYGYGLIDAAAAIREAKAPRSLH